MEQNLIEMKIEQYISGQILQARIYKEAAERIKIMLIDHY